MNLDDLQAALSRANEAKDAAERSMEGASPEQRAALEMELRLASNRAEEARRNLHEAEDRQRQAAAPSPEVCGFGGTDLTPEEAQGFNAPAEQRQQLKDPEAVKELQTVRTYVTERGMLRGAEWYVLSLTSLLGVFIMCSSNNFLLIYLGLECMALSAYALIALRRDQLTVEPYALVMRKGDAAFVDAVDRALAKVVSGPQARQLAEAAGLKVDHMTLDAWRNPNKQPAPPVF